jgi:D-alanyl-D-alanine carboxypeptidase/D-alanyl-D-alanine-endopeptidase (penicillin-binding protein 4)
MNKLLFLLIFFSFSISAQINVKDLWQTYSYKNSLDPETHCFCYQFEGESARSTCGEDKKWSIASLTKIVTSSWLVSKLGLSHRFSTQFFIDLKNNRLHIQGGNDPVLQEDVLIFLITQLNKLGVTRLSEITFDKNFAYKVENLSEEEAKALIKNKLFLRSYVAQKISYLMNTANWASKYYKNFKNKYQEMGDVPESISLSVAGVRFSDNFSYESYLELTYESSTLQEVLKYANAHSNNGIMDYMFSVYGESDYHHYLTNDLDWGATLILNGSGLPYYNGNQRYENKLSCNQVLQVTGRLEEYVQMSHLEMSSMLTTSGLEAGTLLKRFKNTQNNFSKAIWAKTGTINYVSALAGILQTSVGNMKFAYLGRNSSVAKLKAFQDIWLDHFASLAKGLTPNSDYQKFEFKRVKTSTASTIFR